MASMPLFWIALAFLAGILAGSGWGWTWLGWLGLAGLVPLLAVGARRVWAARPIPGWLRRVSFWPVLLLTVALLGASRYRGYQAATGPSSLAGYNDQGPARLSGWIAAPPEARDGYTLVVVEITELQPLGSHSEPAAPAVPVAGRLIAHLPAGESWAYGQRIALEGSPQTPPELEAFSYADFLARQGVYTYLPYASGVRLEGQRGSPFLRGLYALRARAVQMLARLFPAPESALLAGIVLGEESSLPADLQQAFQDTGTAHIIAISGFNIAILAGLFATAFGRLLGPRRGALAAGLGIALYTLLVGASASVMRAAIMGCLGLLARQMGRQQDGLNSLGAAALAMCVFQPDLPWDAGFQLSFMATLGLVLYAAPLQEAFVRGLARRVPLAFAQRISGPVGEYFLFTLAAQIPSLPVMAYHFQRVAWVSLLANPVVLPVQPPVMVLGGLAALLGMLWLPLGQIAAACAWPFVAFTIRAVEAFASLPHGVLGLGPVPLWGVAGYYAILFGWKWMKRCLPRLLPQVRPALGLMGLGLVVALAWRGVFTRPDGNLHLVLLDTGESSGLLLTTPDGRSVLIDGGASGTALSAALGHRLPFSRRGLDALVLTVQDSGHLSALQRAIEQYPPDQAWWLAPPGGNGAAARLKQNLDRAGVEQATGAASLRFSGEGRLSRLPCGERTNALLLEWRSLRAALVRGEGKGVCPQVGRVSLLLLDRAAVKGPGLAAWQAALSPQVTLLDGLPDQSGALGNLGHGWIAVRSDGERLWVETER